MEEKNDYREIGEHRNHSSGIIEEANTSCSVSCNVYGVRHTQIFLMFLFEIITFGIKMNLPISIVAMTNPKYDRNPAIPTYPQWNDISTILSSYLWGFVVTELFGGYLAQRYGFKWFLVVSMIISSVFSFLLPEFTEKFGEFGIMFCRTMQGFSQGIIFPMVANFLSKWVPDNERSFVSTFVYAGGDLGTVIVTALAGWSASSTNLGWPFTFKLYGFLGILWAVVFAIFGASSPESHCSISEDEIDYIKRGRKVTKPRENTPWKKILTSIPVWSLWFCTVSSYWGYWVLSMEVPTFMSDVLGLNIASDSFYMTLIYFISWLLSFPSGGCTQFIINGRFASVGRTRKIMNSIAFYVPALCLVGIGLIQGDDRHLCLALLVVALIVDAFGYCSYYPNYVDISPHYCGTLFGVGLWSATVFTIFCPWSGNHLLRKRNTYSARWEKLFLYTAALYAVSNTIYLFCGTGKILSFDHENDEDEENETTIILSKRTKNEGL